MQFLSNDVGIDLGTSNVLMYVDGKGVIIREPSVVAFDKNSQKVLQVGSAARNMMGRTPGNICAMYPLKGGIISDLEMTVKMLEAFFRSIAKSSIFTPKPRVVISVPSGITEVEERTVINAALEAGARRVYLIEAPLAAALGAGLDIKDPGGHMVVDIGGGVTDMAVLTMNDVAVSASLNLGGDTFDKAIVRYVRQNYNIAIGLSTAEDVKIQIGAAYERGDDSSITVRGREQKTGIPREIPITSSELTKVLERPALAIADEILSVLETAEPDLAGDVGKNGIILTGGGSQLWGIDKLISKRTGILCSVADTPEFCVAYGCGKSLAWINRMTEGPINIARRQAIRSWNQ